MKTGTNHRALAEHYLNRSAEWEDTGGTDWKSTLSRRERLARRTADLAQAQIHATLALAEASNPVELIALVRKEFAQTIATAIRPHCSDCATVALELGRAITVIERPSPIREHFRSSVLADGGV